MGSVEGKPATVALSAGHSVVEAHVSFAESMKAIDGGAEEVKGPMVRAEKISANGEEDESSTSVAVKSNADDDDVREQTVAGVMRISASSAMAKPTAMAAVGIKLHEGVATEPVVGASKKATMPASATKASHPAKGPVAVAVATPVDIAAKAEVDGQSGKKTAVDVLWPVAAARTMADGEPSVSSAKAMAAATPSADANGSPHPVVDAKDVVSDVVADVSQSASVRTSDRVVDLVTTKVEIAPVHSVVPVAPVAVGPIANGVHGAAPAMHVRRDGEASDLTLQSYDAATPNRLEVGVHGGAMGWLKVRAEYGQNGEVNTFLRGASVSTTAMLQMQAPGIATYLGVQEVVVKSVQVEAMRGAGESVSTDAGSGGAGGFTQQEKQRNKESGYDGALQISAGRSVDEGSGGVDFLPGMYAMQSAGSLVGTGGWVNVRA